MIDTRSKDDERLRRQDDFWDISALMPHVSRRAEQAAPRSEGATDAVEIELPEQGSGMREVCPEIEESLVHDGRLDRATSAASRRAARGQADDRAEQNHLVADYRPQHSFIERVRVYDIPSEYNYYEQFLNHAQRIRELRGHPCEPVAFFSYVPEYSQLTRAQLDWYLWWRELVWRGEYREVDYSYIVLYISEIINTGGHSSPEWGQKQLCGLWQAYHSVYRRLNWLLAECICDYSFIWQLDAPDMPRELIEVSSMKEFYMVGKENGSACDAMITYCLNIGYKKSKFASGDAKTMYDKHVTAALKAAFACMCDENGRLRGINLGGCSRVRVAYTGLLCSYKCRKKIIVNYCCFSQMHTFNAMLTDAAKYAENRLRAYLGVKSKLVVKQLDAGMKNVIDDYFDRELPMSRRRPAQPERATYERLYDAPTSAGLSIEAAEQIERESWSTTERLIEAFGGPEPQCEPDDMSTMWEQCDEQPMSIDMSAGSPRLIAPVEPPDSSEAAPELITALGRYMDFVRLVDAGDVAGQHAFAKQNGQMIDSVFDKINEISTDIFGDVILIDDGDGIAIVDDYRGELML